jgi:hypothetical protein
MKGTIRLMYRYLRHRSINMSEMKVHRAFPSEFLGISVTL